MVVNKYKRINANNSFLLPDLNTVTVVYYLNCKNQNSNVCILIFKMTLHNITFIRVNLKHSHLSEVQCNAKILRPSFDVDGKSSYK